MEEETRRIVMRLFGIGLMLSVMALSTPIAWAQGPGRGGPDRGGFGGGAMLLSQKSVQEELKLNEEQVKKVDELLTKQREAFGASRDLSREERQKQFAESRAAGQKAVGEILNEEQQKRYKQISLQLQGPGALGDPDVASAIGLSDDQKKSVEEIQTAAREEMRALFEAGGGDREKFRTARDATNEKLQAVLTDEQKSKWKELTGEPFKGELQGPERGGEGQRRRRSRDGADASSTTTNVLTADKSEEKADGDKEAGKKADKKRDKDKKRDNAEAKPRKGDDKKHASRHKKPHGKHAQAHRGQRQHRDRSEHAADRGHRVGRGEVAAHRGPHARCGHGPQTASFRHARDPRAEAWNRVARAVSHREGPHRWSHRPGPRPIAHRHSGPHHFAGPHFARHQFAVRQFGHRDFGPRHPGRHHGGRPEFARHDFMRRGGVGARHFAGLHGPRRHHESRPEFAHRGPRPGGPGQHRPGHLRRAEGGPDGPRFHHVVEGPRHHGPHAVHDRPHGPRHPAHFAGFRRGDDRPHGEHRHRTKADGDRDHGKRKDAEGKRDGKAPEAPPADDRDREQKREREKDKD
jgi:Spy/CpxP family protein refolding chaperone